MPSIMSDLQLTPSKYQEGTKLLENIVWFKNNKVYSIIVKWMTECWNDMKALYTYLLFSHEEQLTYHKTAGSINST